MHKLLLYLIMLLHSLYILFVVVTPFTNSIQLLMLHSVMIPFMILHWLTNNNTCALTIIEHSLRKRIYGTDDVNECFTYRLITPIYDFKMNNEDFSSFIILVTIVLWFMSLSKLYKMYKNGDIEQYYKMLQNKI
uniref:Uncharacterized protein n=1 Tax=viral metagenome TaxID=1070528 RepID=A0A6C0EB64_9ZZZZ